MNRPVELRPFWLANNQLIILDQSALPHQRMERRVAHLDEACEAIQSLRVRGAPAIALFAGEVLCQHAARLERQGLTSRAVRMQLQRAIDRLKATRPTARNLPALLDQFRTVLDQSPPQATLAAPLRALQDRLYDANHAATEAIALHGQSLIGENACILTHCNAGALAACGRGTALGVVIEAARRGKRPHVFATETRPLLQGARITTWELKQAGVRVTLCTDSMVAALFSRIQIDLVLIGADRIAANGDTANKVGSAAIAIQARHFNIPLYIAAPRSSFDPEMKSGAEIPIEQRNPAEVRDLGGEPRATTDCAVFNPAFDIVPVELITGIICEAGVISPEAIAAPHESRLRAVPGEALV